MHEFTITKEDAVKAWSNPIREKLMQENTLAYARHCVIAEAFKRQDVHVTVFRSLDGLVVKGTTSLGQEISFRVDNTSPLSVLVDAFDMLQLHTVMKLLPMKVVVGGH